MAAAPTSSTTSILLKGGKVVNPYEEGMMDVLIVGDKIERVQTGIDPESCPAGTRVIDCKGKYVMPGGIDPHTHCQLPFMGEVAVDDFYYGTRAAVAGGTTMIIDFAIPSKGESLVATWHKWRSWADPKVNCDYGLHIACTWWDKEGNVAKEMETLVKEHGVTTFKCFMAYKNVFMINDEEMFEVFKQCKKIGAMAQVHAENGDAIAEGSAKMIEKGITGPEGHCMSRPEDVEGEATYRALMIGDRVNTPVYIVHVMSKSACDAVVRARKEGKLAFGEPIAAGLGTDGHNCWHHNWRHAAGYVMGPPLRPCSDTKLYLMKHLATGDLQTVGTDNCTFNGDQKALGKDDFRKIPNGVNGLQDRLSVVWNNGVAAGLITPCQFVQVCSTNVAKLFGCYPRKGILRPGSDADVVVWDGDTIREISAKTHLHACDFNIFEGMKLKGVADMTISRGRIVWADGKFDESNRGKGEYIYRQAFGYPFESTKFREEARDAYEQPVKREPYTGPIAGQQPRP